MSNELPEVNLWPYMRLVLTLVFLACWIFGGYFVDEERVVKTMEANAGIEDIQIIEKWRFFSTVGGCGYADAAGFEVTATRDGQKIKALLCTGWWFKGATIRYQW